ncbi:sugar ABC transporter substrate-binding protein [Candidatus Gottesmanbacteria bacterium]|nr:sugar ABC transporter substrate-binding protein [Candidatus Gottesmanbacteria bacterium]
MDTNEPLSGTIEMADFPVVGQPAPLVAPPPASEAQPVGSAVHSTVGEPENPFIPKGATPEIVPSMPQESGFTGDNGNPLMRRLVMVGAFVGVLLVLFFVGKFILGFLASNKEVTITYWGLWENDATVKNVIAGFESKNPKIKVKYLKQSQKQYREKLQAAIARGDGPDVFRFHNTWVPMLKNDLLPSPKTGMTAQEFSVSYFPVAKNDLVAGSTIFGVPMMIDGLGLYYNEDLFASAGVKPPTTWEELLSIIPKLRVSNGTSMTTAAVALGTTNNIENFSDIVATMMMQNGADLRNPTSKEAEETLVFYRKFADPTDPVYTWNESLDNSIYAFAMGRVAMIFAPSWRAFDIKEMSKAGNPRLRFKIVPIPQLPGNTVTWASYWVEGASSKSKYPDQAWKFIQYLTSKEGETKLYTDASRNRLFGEPYSRVDLSGSVTGDDYVEAYVKQAPSSKSFPLASRTFDNGLNDKLSKYLEDALNAVAKGTAPAQALQTMSAGFHQVFTTYGLSSGTAASPRGDTTIQ